ERVASPELEAGEQCPGFPPRQLDRFLRDLGSALAQRVDDPLEEATRCVRLIIPEWRLVGLFRRAGASPEFQGLGVFQLSKSVGGSWTRERSEEVLDLLPFAPRTFGDEVVLDILVRVDREIEVREDVPDDLLQRPFAAVGPRLELNDDPL